MGAGTAGAEQTVAQYLSTVIPQLITIFTTIVLGFKAIQSHNDRKVKESEQRIAEKINQHLDSLKQSIALQLEGRLKLFDISVEHIEGELKRHDRLIEKLFKLNGSS